MLHFWGCALDSAWQISWWSDSRFKSNYPGSILVFHRKCIVCAPQNGVLAILGGETEIFIFLNPKRQRAKINTRSDVSLAKIGPRVWPGHNPDEQTKLWCRRPSWIFKFLIFEHTTLLGVGVRLCMPNFIMIGHTAQKLLVFMFFIGNALKVPQNWGFWRLWGWKLKLLSS